MNNIIYRFRKITNYSINELLNDSIVGSLRDELNDYYDFRLYYDNEYVISEFKNNDFFLELIRKKHRIDLKNNDKLLKEIITEYAEFVENEITNLFYIVSFSLNNDDELMWNHYADGCKGFALGYDYSELKRRCMNIFGDALLKEVKYVKKRTDHSKLMVEIMSNLLEKVPDLVFNIDTKRELMEASFEKSLSWKYENEIRFISCVEILKNEKTAEHKTIMFPIKPTAIYLGKKCSRKDNFILTYIAKKKGIDIYEPKYENSSEFKISFEKMQNDRINEIIDDFAITIEDKELLKSKDFIDSINNTVKAISK